MSKDGASTVSVLLLYLVLGLALTSDRTMGDDREIERETNCSPETDHSTGDIGTPHSNWTTTRTGSTEFWFRFQFHFDFAGQRKSSGHCVDRGWDKTWSDRGWDLESSLCPRHLYFITLLLHRSI